jgi:hypothetical protein
MLGYGHGAYEDWYLAEISLHCADGFWVGDVQAIELLFSRETAPYRSTHRMNEWPDGVRVKRRANILTALVKCKTVYGAVNVPYFLDRDVPACIYQLVFGQRCFGAPTKRRDAGQDCHRDEVLRFRPHRVSSLKFGPPFSRVLRNVIVA